MVEPPKETPGGQGQTQTSQENPPPTDPNTPPTDPNTPPTDSKPPPTGPKPPPTDSKPPPTDSNTPPTDSKPPPTDSKPPPTGPKPPVVLSKENTVKFVAIFLLLAGVIALTVWLVYRPHKPRFCVVAAAIYKLNATSPQCISTSMQFTLVTRNPNKRVSIIYDNLSAYVSYRNQRITPPVVLPPLYHKTKTTVALSPVLGGVPVPVSAEVLHGLVMDERYGVMNLKVVLLGRLRWKAGATKTRRHGVYVKCDIRVGLKKGFYGQVPLLGTPPCKVDI